MHAANATTNATAAATAASTAGVASGAAAAHYGGRWQGWSWSRHGWWKPYDWWHPWKPQPSKQSGLYTIRLVRGRDACAPALNGATPECPRRLPPARPPCTPRLEHPAPPLLVMACAF